MDTKTTIVSLETAPDVVPSTCPPSICSIGSATEIKKPIARPEKSTTQTLFDLAIVDPIESPIGVIAVSMPVKKLKNL